MGVLGVIEGFGDVVGRGSGAKPHGDRVVSADPAGVLWRTCPRPAETSRFTVVRRQGCQRLQRDPMLPTVTEVVQVGQSISGGTQDLIQTDTVLTSALVALLLVELRDEVRQVETLTDGRAGSDADGNPSTPSQPGTACALHPA